MKRLFQWITIKTQAWFNKVAITIGLLSGILTIVDFVKNMLMNSQNQIPRDKLSVSFITVLAVIGWILFSITVILKYRTSTINKMNVSSEILVNVMRKTITQLREMTDFKICMELRNKEKCDDCKLINRLNDEFISSYVKYTTEFLDEISEVLNAYTSSNGKIALSYKMILPDDINNPQTYGTITLARSNNTLEERKDVDVQKPVPIRDNSDFNNIIDADINQEGKNYFYESNLEEYARLLEKITDGRYRYLNSNPNWRKFYNSTMVVPVCSMRERGEILGFLCADSRSERDLTMRRKDINIRLFQGYASIYSIVVNEFSNIERFIWNKGSEANND